MRVGEHAGVDLRPPVDQQRGDDQEDHRRGRPRRRGCASRRTGTCGLRECGLFRIRITVKVMIPASTPTANRSSMNPMNRPVPDPGDGEGPGEQRAVGLDDGQQQHDEAPERGRVRRARHRPLQQLALPDHLGRLDLHVPAGMLAHRRDALGRGLTGERQPLQPPQPAPRDRQRDGGQDQADSHPHNHAEPPQYPELKRSHAGPATSRAGLVTAELRHFGPARTKPYGVNVASTPYPPRPAWRRRGNIGHGNVPGHTARSTRGRGRRTSTPHVRRPARRKAGRAAVVSLGAAVSGGGARAGFWGPAGWAREIGAGRESLGTRLS